MADSEVIFRRGKQSDEGSDIWDDTALIKAYDNAINAVKVQMGNSHLDDQAIQTSEKDGSLVNTAQKKKKKGKRRPKEYKSKQDESQIPTYQWRKGSHCRAIFTEDGEIYEAIITGIDQEAKTCTVRYLGYGNEEEQLIDDLLPSSASQSLPAGLVKPNSLSTSVQSQLGSESDRESLNSSNMEWQSPKGAKSKHKNLPSWAFPPSGPPPGPWGAAPSMPMPPPMFPPMPPMPFPAWMGSSLPGGFPHIPPPPMSDLDSSSLEDDENALHSMLMSWYMSGYHTGYYQGLKQGKNTRSPKKDKR